MKQNSILCVVGAQTSIDRIERLATSFVLQLKKSPAKKRNKKSVDKPRNIPVLGSPNQPKPTKSPVNPSANQPDKRPNNFTVHDGAKRTKENETSHSRSW